MRLVIRPARLDDHARYAEAPGLERWRALLPHTLVSEEGDRIDGHVTVLAMPTLGHVRHLGGHPACAVPLLRAAAERLRGLGIAEWQATARRDQARAFEALGMTLEQHTRIVRVSLARLHELPAEACLALPVEPSEDGELERELGLLGGRIAMLREQGARLVQLRAPSCAPVGFAAAHGTLVMPFRPARATYARPLLAAVASSQLVHVALDDDSPLTAIGDTTRELLHYRGTLEVARHAA